jgi:hypothetical protein
MTMEDTDIAQDLHFAGDDPAIARLLVKTIARLPEDVQVFAVKRCVYIYASRDYVQAFKGYIGCLSWEYMRKGTHTGTENKAWEEFRALPDDLRWRQIIVLGEITGGDDEAMILIAIGIAHALHGSGQLQRGSEEEQNAKYFAESWGFRSGRPPAGRRGEGATPP